VESLSLVTSRVGIFGVMDRKEKRRRKKWIENAKEEQLRALVFELRQQYEQTKDPNTSEMGLFAFEIYKKKFGLEKLNELQAGFTLEIYYNMIGGGDLSESKDVELISHVGNEVVKKFKIFWKELDELDGFRIFIFDDKDKIDNSKVKTKTSIEALIPFKKIDRVVVFDWVDLPEELYKKLEDHIKLKGLNWS